MAYTHDRLMADTGLDEAETRMQVADNADLHAVAGKVRDMFVRAVDAA